MDDVVTSEDTRYERHGRLQRWGWGAMAGILLLAILGYFGGGGLYATQDAESGRLKVTFDRFLRHQASSVYDLEIRNPGAEPSVRMSHSLMDGFRIETITPEPLRVSRGSSETVFTFHPPPDRLLRVSIYGTAESLWLHSGTIRTGSSVVELSQFTYP